MAAARVGGGWGEAGVVKDSWPYCIGHFIVDFEDDSFGAVFAVLFLVLAADDEGGVHNLFCWMTRIQKVSVLRLTAN